MSAACGRYLHPCFMVSHKNQIFVHVLCLQMIAACGRYLHPCCLVSHKNQIFVHVLCPQMSAACGRYLHPCCMVRPCCCSPGPQSCSLVSWHRWLKADKSKSAYILAASSHGTGDLKGNGWKCANSPAASSHGTGDWKQTNQRVPTFLQPRLMAQVICRVGQNHTFIGRYIWCTYGIFSREITIHTVMYGADVRFWPTLVIWIEMDESVLTILQPRLMAQVIESRQIRKCLKFCSLVSWHRWLKADKSESAYIPAALSDTRC